MTVDIVVYAVLTAPLPFLASAPRISQLLTAQARTRTLSHACGALLALGAVLCLLGPLQPSTLFAFAVPVYQALAYRWLHRAFERARGRPPRDVASDSAPDLGWDRAFNVAFFLVALGPPVLLAWSVAPAG